MHNELRMENLIKRKNKSENGARGNKIEFRNRTLV
jgi:hypothetical protein